jgi:hypothetical protein
VHTTPPGRCSNDRAELTFPSFFGYYALSAGSIAHDDAPYRITKGIGRYPIPVIILTRLGVDVSEQGKRLGAATHEQRSE